MVIKAADAGKHVNCEKPFCNSVREGMEMTHSAEKNGVILAVDESYVFTSSHMRARDMIEEGAIGEPMQIRQRHGNWNQRAGKDADERGEKFAQFPLWIFHGAADDVISVNVSREVVSALWKAGGNPRYTEYPEVKHNSWEKAYRDPELIEWLFAQSRGIPPAPKTISEPEPPRAASKPKPPPEPKESWW